MTQTYTTILIVDDDTDDAEMLQDALHYVDGSIHCIFTEDGFAALKLLENSTRDNLPDLIVLDMNMPRMDGKQCLKKIKASRALTDIPVIIYSTSKMEEDVLETREMGAMNFITKPNKFSEMISIAADILEGKCVFPS
jgi:CheY-like chemotaxis protein